VLNATATIQGFRDPDPVPSAARELDERPDPRVNERPAGVDYDGPMLPTLAISMGDPHGIGAEVTVKALAETGLRAAARWRIYGQHQPMEQAARAAGIAPFWETLAPEHPRLADQTPGVALVEVAGPGLVESTPSPRRPTAISGAASLAFLELAIADCKRTPTDPLRASGLVTAPISKEAWALAGHAEFPGHTELLAARFGGAHVRMMFDAPGLRTILVTTHVPLARVPGLLSIDRITQTIEMGATACKRLGVASPRIAVCGLNPHAGEGGLFGDEDERIIRPAIEAARGRGVDAAGPFPGDTIFNAARRGRYDLVVAMYHDQGLIPVKLLAFDRAVNLTIGLPTVRTSPDHGTAYDIAGANLADPGSMRAALELAAKMAGG
jgi:4-hydroxythreonine-4-phosphate dehydrogenase